MLRSWDLLLGGIDLGFRELVPIRVKFDKKNDPDLWLPTYWGNSVSRVFSHHNDIYNESFIRGKWFLVQVFESLRQLLETKFIF